MAIEKYEVNFYENKKKNSAYNPNGYAVGINCSGAILSYGYVEFQPICGSACGWFFGKYVFNTRNSCMRVVQRSLNSSHHSVYFFCNRENAAYLDDSVCYFRKFNDSFRILADMQ